MRSDFEKYFRNTLFYSNMLISAAESGIAIKPFDKFKGQYRNTYVQLAYSVYAHQQSKVDELKKQKSLQELEINQISHANQQWQLKCNELQKRVDAAHDALTELKEKSEALHHRWNILSDSVALAEAEMIDMCIKELEQALKGESNESST